VIDVRIPVALGASLMLHGSTLALVDRLPQGWQVSTPDRVGAGAGLAMASRSGAVAAPRYLPAEELDERPLIRTPVHPVFPADAPIASGRVRLRLLINETGVVDETSVIDAVPAGVFETAALLSFASARFTPGRKGGVAVKSALTVELRFGEVLPAIAQTHRQELPLFQPPQRMRRPRSNFPQEKP
jgi:TonB family protein